MLWGLLNKFCSYDLIIILVKGGKGSHTLRAFLLHFCCAFKNNTYICSTLNTVLRCTALAKHIRKHLKKPYLLMQLGLFCFITFRYERLFTSA